MAITKAQVRKVLKASKEVISDPDRWYQGDFEDHSQTRFCAAGAIKKIDGPAEHDALVVLAKTILKRYPRIKYLKTIKRNLGTFFYKDRGINTVEQIAEKEPVLLISIYNDSPVRKHEQIMAAFDEAIDNVS